MQKPKSSVDYSFSVDGTYDESVEALKKRYEDALTGTDGPLEVPSHVAEHFSELVSKDEVAKHVETLLKLRHRGVLLSSIEELVEMDGQNNGMKLRMGKKESVIFADHLIVYFYDETAGPKPGVPPIIELLIEDQMLRKVSLRNNIGLRGHLLSSAELFYKLAGFEIPIIDNVL